MKTIIAGTDFSPSSLNACYYAAMLAKKLDCKLTIFNLFEVPAIHSNSGLYFVSYRGIRENHEEKLLKTIEDIKTKFPKLNVEVLLSSGSLKKELEEFVSSHRVGAVVLGLATKTKLSKFIFGSHSTDIAGKINAPVIIVPEQYKKHQLKSILLGVDNVEKLQKTALTQFKTIVSDTNVRLKLLHVRTSDELFSTPKTEFKFLDKVYKTESFFAKDLTDGLNKFVKKNNNDLIAVVSRKHSVFYDYFAETNTKKIAFVSKVPVMAIHE